jgi:hypothetical protein
MAELLVHLQGVGDVPASWLELPFSLTCYDCDAGMEISSIEAAVIAGWRMIQADDGPSWNFLGNCPDCGPEACGPAWAWAPIIGPMDWTASGPEPRKVT